jgi:hypothetical protein
MGSKPICQTHCRPRSGGHPTWCALSPTLIEQQDHWQEKDGGFLIPTC